MLTKYYKTMTHMKRSELSCSLYQLSLKASANRYVFNLDLKDSRSVIKRIFLGREFHSFGPAVEKLRSPYVLRFFFGITSSLVLDDLSPFDDLRVSLFLRYEGARSFKDLNTSRSNLYLIRCFQNRRYMVKFSSSRNETCRCI